MHRIRWDDLQIVMAVAESGSASAAAELLGINHSTVLRRVSAFEEAQGVKLFERHPTGYRATEAGTALLAATRTMQDAVTGIQRELLGQDEKLKGTIQLTTTDTLVSSILAPHLATFRQQHPGIVVNLKMTNVRLDIARLDAEVSIRPSRNPPEQLIGRRASGLAFGVYAHAQAKLPPLPDITQWIGIANELRNSPVDAWMNEHVPESSITVRADSFAALRELARAGLGAAVLPCCLGDTCPKLVRLSPPLPELDTSLWVLTHPDLKKSARVGALSDFLTKALKSERSVLEGTAADASAAAAQSA